MIQKLNPWIIMTKYNNQYRQESNRMPGWDYSGNGYYFITIITRNRECVLGYIENEEMILSDFGKIVEHEWQISAEIRKEIILDEYIFMPNHMHAIVILKKPDSRDGGNTRDGGGDGCGDGCGDVETHGRASLQSDGRASHHPDGRASLPPDGRASLLPDGRTSNRPDDGASNRPDDGASHQPDQSSKQKLMRKPKSLSSFVAGYKSACTTKIDDFIDLHQLPIAKYNKSNRFWQINFHDHIIRDKKEYWRIKNYIKNNPKNWTGDTSHDI